MGRSNPQAVIDWRRRTKERIVEAMGSKCCECGYNTTISALDLHHLDPSEKRFSFAGIRARPKSWKTIVDELKKCILVCANCHREIESGFRAPTRTETTFDSSYEQYDLSSKFSHPEENYKYDIDCFKCGTKFKAYRPTAKYCSESCRRKK